VQRPRPAPLVEAASCEQFFQGSGNHLQLPLLKPSSLPPTPRSDGTDGSRASSIGVLRSRPAAPLGLPSPVQAPLGRARRSPTAEWAPRPPRDVAVPSPSGERVDVRPSPQYARRLASLSEEPTRSSSRTHSRRRVMPGLGCDNPGVDVKGGVHSEALADEEHLPHLLGGSPQVFHSKLGHEPRCGRIKPEILS